MRGLKMVLLLRWNLRWVCLCRSSLTSHHLIQKMRLIHVTGGLLPINYGSCLWSRFCPRVRSLIAITPPLLDGKSRNGEQHQIRSLLIENAKGKGVRCSRTSWRSTWAPNDPFEPLMDLLPSKAWVRGGPIQFLWTDFVSCRNFALLTLTI